MVYMLCPCFYFILVIAVRPIISNIHPTDLYGMCTYGRTLAVDERSEVIFFDPSRDVAMATNFCYRAMLCIRGTSHGPMSVRPSVCPSVRQSQVGVLLKRLNIGSHKQHHTIAQGL